MSHQPHYDSGQLLVAESWRAYGASGCVIRDRPDISSLPNPDARFAFTMFERSSLSDHLGIDFIFKTRHACRGHSVSGLPWEIAHGQKYQWESHLIQVKEFQKGDEEHGRVMGLVLPLPNPLPNHLQVRLTPYMIQVARKLCKDCPFVNCLLFVSAATTPEERVKAHDMIWQETLSMIGTREQLLCGHRFSDQPDPASQP